MYILSDFLKSGDESVQPDFLQFVKATWDNIHKDSNVFRYKIKNLRERIVDKYLLQLNPDRSSNRRLPEQIENVCQPFDKDKFNFTKISNDEIIFAFANNNNEMLLISETCEHFLIVNVSPISQYHSLLCPSMHKCLPQVVTVESLQLVIDIILITKDRDLKIGFNSLCGLASVNHLHYHLFIERNVLPVEIAKCKHIKGPVYCLDNYPAPAFCFEVTQQTIKASENIFRIVDFLLKKSIAHNIMFTYGQSVTADVKREIVRVIIWPRKNSTGAKQLAAFNVAVCELSGWFPVYDGESFMKLTSEELEAELRKWKYDGFDDLCEEIKKLF
ncbi:GDP-D-glucose phosphorylase 1 [Battus philenor]|uniref:GDP-D-glucose phosphorylase 1 n=1 Tax=Battus philenor TaxID=42288 RepID=UPI0035D0BC0D